MTQDDRPAPDPPTTRIDPIQDAATVLGPPAPPMEAIQDAATVLNPPHDPEAVAEAPTLDLGAAPPAASRAVPVVPGYEILGELGRGGMGVVYRARQARLRRDCALKMILGGAHADAEACARFLAEAEAVARLQHAHIVQIHAIGDADGLPFFELEFVDGGSLAGRLDGTPWAPRDAARLVETLARAMQAAHDRGVVHRDLKPQNVLLMADGTPKITDFGLAKRLDLAEGLTRSGAIMGTPSYMAPEQAGSKLGPIGPAADIYALGAILYELLTGRPPFRASTPFDTIMQVLGEEPLPPSRLVPGVPRDLETIALTCLQKDPGRRFGSASALADDLRRFLDGAPIQARPVGPVERAWRWCRRNAPLASALASALVLLLALVVGSVAVALDQRREAAILRHETAIAEANAARAEAAERAGRARLWAADLAHAQAARWSHRPGQRRESLRSLAEAARIRPAPELRDEAIACMALADLQPAESLPLWTPETVYAAFDRSLGRVARSDARGNLSVRRVADDRELARLPGFGTHAWRFRFSADGRSLLAIYHLGGELRLWDLERGRLVRKFAATGFDFSPDGRLAVVGNREGTIGVYDARDGHPVRILKARGHCYYLAVSPDGRTLAYCATQGTPDNVIHLIDAESGRVRRTLTHPRRVHELAWHPGGGHLAASSADNRIYIWDLQRGGATVLEGRLNHPDSLGFSPDGRLLASGGWDGVNRLWDPVTGRQLLSVPGAVGPVRIARDRLGTLRAGRNLELWSCEPSREYRVLAVGGGCHDLAFGRGGRLLAAVAEDGVHLVDTRNLRDLAVLKERGGKTVEFDRDGRLLLCGEAGLHRWPIRPGRAGTLEIGPVGHLSHDHGLTGATDLPGDLGLALADHGGQRIILADDRGQGGRTLAAVQGIERVVASPDGRWLAGEVTWEFQRGLRVWDLRGGRLATTLDVERDAQATFSPDGRWLVSSTTSEFRFWRVGSWASVRSFPKRNGGRVAFRADGSMAALAVSPTEILLVEPASGRTLGTLTAPDPDGITGLGFSPDGGRLAAILGERMVQVWDLRLIHQQLLAMGLARDWPALATPEPSEAPSGPIRLLEPAGPAELVRLGNQAAASGHWAEASAHFARAIARGDRSRTTWNRYLLGALRAGDLEGYRKGASDLLRRHNPALGPEPANDLAWDLVLGPRAVGNVEAAVRLAERALAGMPPEKAHLVLNTLGAALYRANRPGPAIRRIQEGIRRRGGGGFPQDWAFLAMAHAARGELVEAQRWLDRLEHAPTSRAPAQLWNSAEVEVLRREARAVVLAAGPDLPAEVFAP